MAALSVGKVTFNVTNASGMEHELVVIKTSKKAAKLQIVNATWTATTWPACTPI